MKYFVQLLIILMWSCSIQTPEEKIIERTLGKELNLSMFKNVLHQGDTISLENFNKKFKYKSIVYLLNGCSPCYSNYIRWHQEFKIIEPNDNYTILFVIRGKFVDEFITEVDSVEPVDHDFYIVMDPNYFYPDGNKEIPDWIFEKSILIDEDNKIKMIGQPFQSPELLERFEKIINE